MVVCFATNYHWISCDVSNSPVYVSLSYLRYLSSSCANTVTGPVYVVLHYHKLKWDSLAAPDPGYLDTRVPAVSYDGPPRRMPKKLCPVWNSCEETILYQAVSCFSGKELPLVFQSVMYLYLRMYGVNRNEKMKGNFCMNFPYYCNTIYLIIPKRELTIRMPPIWFI